MAKSTLRSFVIILLHSGFLYGQKTEINMNAYSGFFSFSGNGAASNSWIISYPFINTPTTYTINPFGKKSAFSYALELQGQRLTKTRNIYGLGVSLDKLTSRVDIYKVGISGDPAYLEYPSNGKTKLDNTFITLNPFIGHRYAFGKLTFDLLAGADFSFCTSSMEQGKATINNKEYLAFENDKPKPSVDFRPRFQLKAQMNKTGILAGYSYGLTNYQANNSLKAYSSFLRLGISYQLK